MPTVALIPSWDGLGYGDKPNAYPFLTTPSQLVKAQQVRLGCSVCLESGILGERHPSMCKAWDGSAVRQVDTYAPNDIRGSIGRHHLDGRRLPKKKGMDGLGAAGIAGAAECDRGQRREGKAGCWEEGVGLWNEKENWKGG
ncbi:hypothetical protein K469DRAFT_76503 [Zopfia rhizophila CBS 207.26]|uniref:Uncharacterized protein n=1 Tax=Zopfia rhizophila CBS 207.26 TaxID=1314779 RepID=A0A6A6EBH1_9PEZI|nr:hypothetical protein K469DRAFT_76503 [Zopfia rhizophila CBS 207.26]